MERGLIHIYCGDGKGKTSSAVGLAVRAAGCKKKVLFARFLKNENSGELNILDSISDIEVLHLEKSYGFYKTLTEKEKKEVNDYESYKNIRKKFRRRSFTGKRNRTDRFLCRLVRSVQNAFPSRR